MANDQLIYEWHYDEASRMRLDKFLAEERREVSRSQIQAWIKEGRVTVNGRPVKPNYKLAPNDQILLRLPPPETLTLHPEPMVLDIVYEDEDLLVINKPRGLVVHPAPGHYSGTLVNGLLAYGIPLSSLNGMLRPGIVHRLDKDTSGLIMVAKNDETHLSLAQQLKEQSVLRKYTAVVHGVVAHRSGTIDAPIGRDPRQRLRMAVVPSGKQAITHFEVKARFKKFTLLECRLETGRTHQIRVHLKYIGHPVVGDPIYGRADSPRFPGQALHAKVLGFKHPSTGKEMFFETELPEDIVQLIKSLA